MALNKSPTQCVPPNGVLKQVVQEWNSEPML
jgi:hypothetical protein